MQAGKDRFFRESNLRALRVSVVNYACCLTGRVPARFRLLFRSFGCSLFRSSTTLD
jgi:hypothetical protein